MKVCQENSTCYFNGQTIKFSSITGQLIGTKPRFFREEKRPIYQPLKH